MCGAQHSIVDINHRFVYKNDDDRFIHVFIRSFDVLLLCFRCALFCFVLDSFVWKMFFEIGLENLEHWLIGNSILMFWSRLIAFWRRWHRAILRLHLIWTGFDNLLRFCWCAKRFQLSANSAMLQINCFLMWKKGDDFTLIAIHTV